MEEALELGMRIHERLEKEQTALARIATARRNMGGGFDFSKLPISVEAAKDILFHWRLRYAAMSDIFFHDRVEPDYSSIESRILATMPEGVSPYGLPSSMQEKTATQKNGQKSDKAG